MQLVQPGLVSYAEMWEMQRRLFQGAIAGTEEDTLILVEHPPVYTLGRVTELSNVLFSEETLARIGAEKFEIERGGDVTFHGPGQLVGYPILNLSHFKEDLGWYLRAIEETIIEVLATYDLRGFRLSGWTGVWVGEEGHEQKICAIGVKVSRWCTMHGFAFNVSTDLSYFDHIIPCGISERGVTSLERVLGCSVSMVEIQARYVEAFERVFGVALESTTLSKQRAEILS